MTATVPTIHFDTDVLPESERFDRWRAAIAAYDISRPSDALLQPFHATVDAWDLGDLVVTSNRLDAARFVRSVDKIKADGIDHYSLFLSRQGSWFGDTGDGPLTIGPGQVVAFDLTRPMDAEWSGGYCITLSIARHVIDTAIPHVPDLHGATLGGSMGRLLADHLTSLVNALPATEQSEVPAVVKATVGLMTSCLAAIEKQPAARLTASSAVRHRIRRHIDRHLTAADLTPGRIASDLDLSRATLYRAFAPLGGVASYIRTRRLEAVHVLLSDPRERRSIADIAYDFGFVSDAHFSRAFRQQFGYSPSSARRAIGHVTEGAASASHQDGPAQFRKWIDRLA
jgi:AraC-like DNA-binding protein